MKQSGYLIGLSFIALLSLLGCKKNEIQSSEKYVTGAKILSDEEQKLIEITGNGFGDDKKVVRVTLNNKAAAIRSVSDEKIIVEIPDGEFNGTLKVTVNDIGIGDQPFPDLVLKVGLYAGIPGEDGYVDGASKKSKFVMPLGMVADKNGNIFVSDYFLHCIRKITPAGIVSTFAGTDQPGYLNGQGTEARFSGPTVMTIDKNDNIYVYDSDNRRIRRITPLGLVSTYAGSGIKGETNGMSSQARFSNVGGLHMDEDTLYLTSTYSVRKIYSIGLLKKVALVAGDSADKGNINGDISVARFTALQGITKDAKNNFYVLDDNCIRRITSEGMVSTFSGGTMPGLQDGYYATAKFVSPDNIILGNDGLLYVADGTYRIRRVDMRGNASTYAGSSVGYQNGPALSAKFHKLWSMCQNSYGAIFVTEYNVVRKIFY